MEGAAADRLLGTQFLRELQNESRILRVALPLLERSVARRGLCSLDI